MVESTIESAAFDGDHFESSDGAFNVGEDEVSVQHLVSQQPGDEGDVLLHCSSSSERRHPEGDLVLDESGPCDNQGSADRVREGVGEGDGGCLLLVQPDRTLISDLNNELWAGDVELL